MLSTSSWFTVQRFFLKTLLLSLACSYALTPPNCNAHDIWIETANSLARRGEPVVIELKLGNCLAGKPDAKIAGQLPRPERQAFAILPSEETIDMTKSLVSSTSVSESGCWRTTVTLDEIGCTWLSQRLDDKVVHGGKRVLGRMTAKTPLVVTDDKNGVALEIKSAAHSQIIEILLESSPLPSVASRLPVRVRLLKNNQPWGQARLAFTRPLATRKDGSVQFEYLETDQEGRANWLPDIAGPLLISFNHLDETETGEDFEATYYSTTMFLNVSNRELIH